MKKKIFNLGLLMFCSFALIGIVSCGGNSDDSTQKDDTGKENDNKDTDPNIDTSKPVVTYYYNYEGADVYKKENYTLNDRIKAPAEPSREGYIFVAWYTDSALTTEYNFKTMQKETSLSLYAKWMKAYTFEAEYTSFKGKAGFGYSGNISGTDMIYKDDGSANASNGYFVTGLYYNGAYLDFEITSAADISGVYLVARLSSEFYDMAFDNDNLLFLVNDTTITDTYSIDLSGALPVSSGKSKRPFTNHTISKNVSLKEGSNVVRIQVNNENGHGGTMYADAPLVDCIYLGTDETLSWNPVESNVANK